jgi:hypothetical protein
MKYLGLIVLAAVVAAPAQAAVVYSNNFESENGGAGALNYNSFNGLTVSDGTVDLVGGSFGITCSPAGGLCVDLDGSSSNSGVLASTNVFAFGANQRVTLSFALSGSQIFGIDDTVAALRLSSPQLLTSTGYTHNGSVIDQGPSTADTLTLPIGTASVASFGQFTLFFRSSQAGQVRFDFSTTSNDNVGAVLDDVSLSVADAVAPVPEPTTWALMIGGFGMAGAAVRRRIRTAVIFA